MCGGLFGGGGTPVMPKAPAPPKASRAATSDLAAAFSRERGTRTGTALTQNAFRGTLLTSPTGVGAANLGRSTLLGQ